MDTILLFTEYIGNDTIEYRNAKKISKKYSVLLISGTLNDKNR